MTSFAETGPSNDQGEGRVLLYINAHAAGAVWDEYRYDDDADYIMSTCSGKLLI